MAPLQIIGAGFGRTGTHSLRVALDMLGYNTHHMITFAHDHEKDPLFFKRAYEHPEEEHDWDEAYKGYDAAVDWPTAAFLEPLMKKYPNAKVILTERDADSWYRSVKNSIFQASKLGPIGYPRAEDLHDMIKTVILDGDFADAERFADEEAIKRRFVEHNEHVRKIVPPEKLLVVGLGEGWDRLCEFLGKDVPNEPYPNTNSTAEFQERLENRRKEYAAAGIPV
ncbi:hypothetical protein DFQ28_001572 [Apophysomyces sp. BC1034]|nr:hypothetical protein DFQ30_001483 [Apophysomyces sp. BC1015]KAG0182515.1 hypothetical protein DFQ29_003741 [Apophysomyces sp. BC1021]KAG0194080.1 hypothetical protein DFQ28_001572 [Apophysomyces sp. BC1034]